MKMFSDRGATLFSFAVLIAVVMSLCCYCERREKNRVQYQVKELREELTISRQHTMKEVKAKLALRREHRNLENQLEAYSYEPLTGFVEELETPERVTE